jgi:hypothetical protein
MAVVAIAIAAAAATVDTTTAVVDLPGAGDEPGTVIDRDSGGADALDGGCAGSELPGAARSEGLQYATECCAANVMKPTARKQ